MKSYQNDFEMRQWIVFDPIIPDDILASLCDPFIPVEIIRGANTGIVVLYADSRALEGHKRRFDQWADDFRVDYEKQQRIESEARFKAYLDCLDLSDEIKIPALATTPNGGHEACEYVISH